MNSTELTQAGTTNPPPPATRKAAGGWKPWSFLTENPVILKELKGRMRDRRAFIMLSFYLSLISLVIGLAYSILSDASGSMNDPSMRQTAGKTIFGVVVLVELLLVSLIGPALTSGSIASERERQTFDLLRTSLLSARSLVWGKLGAGVFYLLLLILTAVPIQALAFLLGGVGLSELIVSSLMLTVTALAFCALGLFFSSFMKRTLSATVSAYATILGSVVFLIVFFISISYMGVSSYGNSSYNQNLTTLLVWFVLSTSPLPAAVISEVILIDEQSLFVTRNSPFGSSTLALPSPWIIFVLVYLALTLLMVLVSIRFVQRPDR